MANLHHVCVICVIALCHHRAGEALRPQNTAVLKGETVQLNCSKEKYNPFWTFTRPLHDLDTIRIYNGYNVADSLKQTYSVDVSVKDQFNLLFNSFDSTSGRYVCEKGLSDSHSAEVIVLDGNPVCSRVDASESSLTLTCSLNFTGNWSPTLEWVDCHGNQINVITYTVPNENITSSLYLAFSQSTDNNYTSDDYKSCAISCRVEFNSENKPGRTTASNKPEFLYNCSFPEIFSTGVTQNGTHIGIIVGGIIVGVGAVIGGSAVVAYAKTRSKAERKSEEDHSKPGMLL